MHVADTTVLCGHSRWYSTPDTLDTPVYLMVVGESLVKSKAKGVMVRSNKT